MHLLEMSFQPDQRVKSLVRVFKVDVSLLKHLLNTLNVCHVLHALIQDVDKLVRRIDDLRTFRSCIKCDALLGMSGI